MPELGPYGSMRGEVRENLPYRDHATARARSYPRRDAGMSPEKDMFWNKVSAAIPIPCTPVPV